MDSTGTPGSDGSPAVETPPAQPPASPTVPDGMELVPREELATLRRTSENYRGNAPLINELVGANIRTREDLAAVLGPVKQAREMGLDLNGVLTTMRPPQANAQPATEERPLTRSEFASLLEEREAKARHEAAAAQEGNLIRGLVDQLVGEKGSEVERRAARGLVYDYMAERTAVYDSGPYKGQVIPLSEREFSQIQKDAAETWRTIRGQQLHQVAANAGTARVAPPAPGGAGAAAPTTAGNVKPGSPEHRAQVMARLDQLEARRAGAPLSQA